MLMKIQQRIGMDVIKMVEQLINIHIAGKRKISTRKLKSNVARIQSARRTLSKTFRHMLNSTHIKLLGARCLE